jgi:PAS domain S-box-containing protein
MHPALRASCIRAVQCSPKPRPLGVGLITHISSGRPDVLDIQTLRTQAELLDLTDVAIFVRDLEQSRITYWNRGAEELYGWASQDAEGKISHQLLNTQFPIPLPEVEEALIRDGRWQGELRQMTRSGSTVIVASRWALQRDESGRPRAFLEVNHDITQRKEAEDKVRELNRTLRNRAEELSAVNESITAISRGHSLRQVLQNIADAARSLVGCEYAALGVADSGVRIVDFITSGLTQQQRDRLGQLPAGHGLLGVLIRQGIPLRIPKIANHPDSYGFPPNHPPMDSLLGVPIIFNDTIVGDLYLTNKIGAPEFSEEDEGLLLQLAGHAGVAIQNATLFEEAVQARIELTELNEDLEARVAERTKQVEHYSRELTTRVLAAQEDERKRIARELHDETAQSLVTLLITLDMLEAKSRQGSDDFASTFERVRSLAKRTLDETRALSHNLRPSILDDVGLLPVLDVLAEDHSGIFGTEVILRAEETLGDRLPGEMEVALFRIVQEALMNVGKYSHADQVLISLGLLDGTVKLDIVDDGIGFDVSQLRAPTREGGMGLFGMQERVSILGGSMSIVSNPGTGTGIHALIPLPGNTHPD